MLWVLSWAAPVHLAVAVWALSDPAFPAAQVKFPAASTTTGARVRAHPCRVTGQVELACDHPLPPPLPSSPLDLTRQRLARRPVPSLLFPSVPNAPPVIATRLRLCAYHGVHCRVSHSSGGVEHPGQRVVGLGLRSPELGCVQL
jgi:hypothetical protein